MRAHVSTSNLRIIAAAAAVPPRFSLFICTFQKPSIYRKRAHMFYLLFAIDGSVCVCVLHSAAQTRRLAIYAIYMLKYILCLAYMFGSVCNKISNRYVYTHINEFLQLQCIELHHHRTDVDHLLAAAAARDIFANYAYGAPCAFSSFRRAYIRKTTLRIMQILTWNYNAK